MKKVDTSIIINHRLNNLCATQQEIADSVGLSRERVRQILKKEHAPTRSYSFGKGVVCSRCGGRRTSGHLHCMKCHHELHTVPIVCPSCGKISYRWQSQVLYRIKKINQKNFFCSRSCFYKFRQKV